MKIAKISIKDYRSCSHTEFRLHKNLSVLIGPNGSGKTNVLTAIRLLTALADFRYGGLGEDEPAASESEIKVWYDWNGRQVVHTAVLHLITNERNEDEIVGSDESWDLSSITGSKEACRMSLRDCLGFTHEREKHARTEVRESKTSYGYTGQQELPEEAFQAVKDIVRFVRKIKYYSASQFTNPTNCPVYIETRNRFRYRHAFRHSVSYHEKFLHDLYSVWKSKSDTYHSYFAIVGPDGLNLVKKISWQETDIPSYSFKVRPGGEASKKEQKNFLVIPIFDIHDKSLSPSQLSEGTLKILALIFYLMTDESALFMIEEPETSIHHGLLDDTMELINSFKSEKQIIISTHSDYVLDKVHYESVFVVKRYHDKGTRVTHILEKLDDLAVKALKYHLKNTGNLGEYWKHGGIEYD